jgi:DNA excision repair protein ERCC-2
VYFDIASQQETSFVEKHTAPSLRAFFEASCRELRGMGPGSELAHSESPGPVAWPALAFPHPAFPHRAARTCESVYKGVASGRCLMAQAPTASARPAGTVFRHAQGREAPRPGQGFYLTAKSTGRRLALDAAALMEQGASARRPEGGGTDRARQGLRASATRPCHGDSCPLARGFYDRLPAARRRPWRRASWTASALREVARSTRSALLPGPGGLALADIVVGDYNYYFDGSAMLHTMTLVHEWRVGVLADEAHNLVERARAMYSADWTRLRCGPRARPRRWRSARRWTR